MTSHHEYVLRQSARGATAAYVLLYNILELASQFTAYRRGRTIYRIICSVYVGSCAVFTTTTFVIIQEAAKLTLCIALREQQAAAEGEQHSKVHVRAPE